MAQKRKLRRFGSRTYGLTFGTDMLELLGSSVEEAESEQGVEFEVSFYGETLVARRVGSPRPSPAEVAYFITEDFDYASFFPTSPVGAAGGEVKPRLNIGTLFKPGKSVKMTKLMRETVRLIAEHGTMTSEDLVEQSEIQARQATRVLRAGYEEGLFVSDGVAYSLNPELFDI